MATGPEALQAVRNAAQSGQELWVDVEEKLDLCKLKTTDLVAAGIPEEKAKHISSILLSDQNISALGEAFGVNLRQKSKVWAEREGSKCIILVEGHSEAESVRELLLSSLPELTLSELEPKEDARFSRFEITLTDVSQPWKILKTLADNPRIRVLRSLPVRVEERPHYLVQPEALASWIDDRGQNTWWSVDGDPLLMRRLDFPCPPDEISKVIRDINQPLLVADPSEFGSGEELLSQELARLALSDGSGEMKFFMSWQNGENDWLLSENEPLLGI